jgi:hypothetical protein
MLRKSKKLFMAAAFALMAMTAFASTASAASFSVSPAGNLTAASNGTVTFTAAGFITIQCNLSLSTNLLAGPIAKTVGARFGSVTNVTWAGCTGGTLNSVAGLPWNLTYTGFSGTLPGGVTAIGLNVNAPTFTLTAAGTTCTYSPTVVPASLAVTGSNPYTSGLITIGANSTPGRGSSILCGFNGSLRGSFRLSTAQTITRT